MLNSIPAILLKPIFILKRAGLFFVLLIGFSCSNSETVDEEIEERPSSFEVRVESAIYTQSEISWSESFDPQGDIVTYSVYLEDALLASNLTERSYSFSELSEATQYLGRVVASDGESNERESVFALTTSANAAPSAFEVISVEVDNVSAQIEWSSSIDPEGETVTYKISLDGLVIEEDYQNNTIDIDRLEADVEYAITIIASDERGNTADIDFNFRTANGIYDGDVTLLSQFEVDDFGAQGYKEITGFFTINGVGGSGDVSNLNALNTIEIIGKTFRILRNRDLESLSGLENLREVRGGFEIHQNEKIEEITELISLETIGTSLWIRNNNAITRISGFNKLQFIETLFIEFNATLTDIQGFENVLQFSRDLSFGDNPMLNSVSGFDKLELIDRLFLEDTELLNLDFLSSVTTIGSELRLRNNSSLININGLSGLTEITFGSLFIYTNPELVSLEGLDNLASIGGSLEIRDNTLLVDFCALQNALTDFTPSFRPSILNNAFNPTITDIANGICKP